MKVATKSEVKTKKSQRPSQLSKSIKKVKEGAPAKVKAVETDDFIFPEQGKWMTESLLKLLSKWNIISVGLALGYFAVFHIVQGAFRANTEYLLSLLSAVGKTLSTWDAERLWNDILQYSYHLQFAVSQTAALGLGVLIVLFLGSQAINYKKWKLNILSFLVILAIFIRIALVFIPYAELYFQS